MIHDVSNILVKIAPNYTDKVTVNYSVSFVYRNVLRASLLTAIVGDWMSDPLTGTVQL